MRAWLGASRMASFLMVTMSGQGGPRCPSFFSVLGASMCTESSGQGCIFFPRNNPSPWVADGVVCVGTENLVALNDLVFFFLKSLPSFDFSAVIQVKAQQNLSLGQSNTSLWRADQVKQNFSFGSPGAWMMSSQMLCNEHFVVH